ncbi:hypothetical protein [Curvibacter sp. PAE-UM]|nr:hypothetical protein [Curvibacter sp. PAE-UM]
MNVTTNTLVQKLWNPCKVLCAFVAVGDLHAERLGAEGVAT